MTDYENIKKNKYYYKKKSLYISKKGTMMIKK